MASTTFVDGETLIEASWLNDVNAAVYTPGTVTAADIANVQAGNITATDVQAAINELDSEKQPLDALLTALAAQTTSANTIQAYSGADTPTLLTIGTASGNVPLVGIKSATDTLAGLVELATQAEAEAGTDDTVAMTALKTAQAIAATGLGINQTWQEQTVGVDRSSATAYQNTSTSPIMVAVSGNTNGALKVECDASNPPTTIVSNRTSTSDFAEFSFIVPPSFYYEVTGNINSWSELK
jgi:hypothetical protein